MIVAAVVLVLVAGWAGILPGAAVAAIATVLLVLGLVIESRGSS